MIDLFKQHHWNLEIKRNLKIADYLDLMFDLTIRLFEPYNKNNNFPRYVNAKSHHPPSILKELRKLFQNVFRQILVMFFEKEQYTH